MKTQAVTKSDKYSQGLEFTLNSDGKSYSVSGIGTCTDKDIIIPNTYNNISVTSIGDCAFYNCKGLTSITIPNSVTSIGDRAFEYCTGLTSITMQNGVTSIGEVAFCGCTGLTSITIPNSVTSIEQCTFSSCTGLTSITIPNSVTRIGNYAFYNCTGFTSITIPNSVASIGQAPFSNCTGLTSINVDSKNAKYHSVNNCLIETATKTLIASCKNSVIPSDGSVTIIGTCAFAGCTGLTSIMIPNSVTRIGNYAFQFCSGITSITIPNSVTSIGDCAFYGCTGLTSITIPNSVTSIGESAFYGCTGLHKNGTFKATDEDMCCRQFQYNLGEKFETTHASLCHRGFHFCTNAFDLLNYYSGEIGRTVRFFEVKVDKVTEEHSSDSKRVCKEITFLREIKSYAELLN